MDRGKKNGMVSANTLALCAVVCCPSQGETTTQERFHPTGDSMMQKERGWEEQQGVYRDSRAD